MSRVWYCYIVIWMIMQHHNDPINKQTQEDFFIKNVYLSLYCKSSKRVTQGLRVRGSWRPNITAIFWPQTYGRQRCVFLVRLMLNRRPWGPLCWVLASFTASYQHILWTSTHQGPKPLRPGVVFPTTSRPQLALELQLKWLDFCLDWAI